jgi:hypothetical protein
MIFSRILSVSALLLSVTAIPCDPIVPPPCNGTWTCENGLTPVYNERYGFICPGTTVLNEVTNLCPLGGVPDINSCKVFLNGSSYGCPDFTEVYTTNPLSCVYHYPINCPSEYIYNTQINTCVKYTHARCDEKPPCDTYVCANGTIPRYVNSTVPICVYNTYPAPANADGYLFCENGATLFEKICVEYSYADYIPCPSETPRPSVVQEKPSESSRPSVVQEKPSETPRPSVVQEKPSSSSKPCDKYYCPDGMIPEYIYGFSEPVCIYGRYNATIVDNTTNTIGCDQGGMLINRECILFEPSIYIRCSETPRPSVVQEKPSESSRPSVVQEKPSETSRPSVVQEKPSETPRPSVVQEKPSETPRPSVVQEKPSETPRPSVVQEKPCDRYFCPDGMIPQFISGFSKPVCVYRSYPAILSENGEFLCPEGGKLIADICILFEESIYESRCSVTPSPTPVRQQESSKPTLTAPAKPSYQVPVISATITIEITTNATVDATNANMTVFSDPVILQNIKEAIAKALNIDMNLIVIESISWIRDGALLTTVNVLNTSGRRALQDGKDNYNINYSIVNPPPAILITPISELTAKVENSALLLTAATSVVEGVTGNAVAPGEIGISNSNMGLNTPAEQQVTQANSDFPFGIFGGGIAAGAALIALIGFVAFRTKKSKMVKKIIIDDSIEVISTPDRSDSPPLFTYVNKHFSHRNVRDIIAMNPMQIRRNI